MWLDYDHDYDLDLVLLGAQPALMRNQGTAGWADRTADFPFVKGSGRRCVESSASIPTARLSIWPCSIRIADPVCIAINSAADTQWRVP